MNWVGFEDVIRITNSKVNYIFLVGVKLENNHSVLENENIPF